MANSVGSSGELLCLLSVLKYRRVICQWRRVGAIV